MELTTEQIVEFDSKVRAEADHVGTSPTDGMHVTTYDELVKWAMIGITARLYNKRVNKNNQENLKVARRILKELKDKGETIEDLLNR